MTRRSIEPSTWPMSWLAAESSGGDWQEYLNDSRAFAGSRRSESGSETSAGQSSDAAMTGAKSRLTHEERRAHTAALLSEVQSTLDAKGMDYSGGPAAHAGKNFDDVSSMLGVGRRVVWLVYFAKHVLAVARYCKDGKFESEPIRSRIVDCIGYLCLLASMEEEK